MDAVTNTPETLRLESASSFAARQAKAVADVREAAQLWRLWGTLGWLDIKLRYRGSVLGPLWLTLSTAVMVGALGVLYSALFHMDLHDYLPFLGLSIVLWNFIATLVGDACTCFTSAEGLIRSARMPFNLYAARVVWRNLLILAHNVIVIVLVFAIFQHWPGSGLLLCLPGLLIWLIDSMAITLLLGAFCARFRDIPPIVASVMQIAFFISPIIWRPEQAHISPWLLAINPFYSLLEVVRGPLLNEPAALVIWASVLIYSALLCGGTWLLFVRVRGRLSFWV